MRSTFIPHIASKSSHSNWSEARGLCLSTGHWSMVTDHSRGLRRASYPSPPFAPAPHHPGENHRDDQRGGVTVGRLEFRHVFEVHGDAARMKLGSRFELATRPPLWGRFGGRIASFVYDSPLL